LALPHLFGFGHCILPSNKPFRFNSTGEVYIQELCQLRVVEPKVKWLNETNELSVIALTLRFR
jgi:hypothetical protein